MKNIIFPIAFCLLCIITNPSNSQHKEKLDADFANKHSFLGALEQEN